MVGAGKLERHSFPSDSEILQRADQTRDELLAMLAHELRTPLGAISNALQVLRLKGAGDETCKRAVAAAERQVLHQALLIEELLEASRVRYREIELHCEELDLVQLVRASAEGYRNRVRESGLTLGLDLPAGELRVRGDRLRLSQALSNLLKNAVKFTAPGGQVTVEVALAGDGRWAEVRVCDTGAGIDPAELPFVFEVFTQGDHSLDRPKGGLGVGLAVVKGLVEMHGGEVEAMSSGLGKGAEFAVRLPLVEAAWPAEAEAGEGPLRTARRILIVEDNPDAAAMLRDFLELSGHEVELAATGGDGIAAARQFHPEVVLCDIGLPGMDGFEVAAELRRDPDTRSAQLIAVTGYGGEDDRRRSKEAGFDLHLTKPLNPVQLEAVLQRGPGVH